MALVSLNCCVVTPNARKVARKVDTVCSDVESSVTTTSTFCQSMTNESHASATMAATSPARAANSN